MMKNAVTDAIFNRCSTRAFTDAALTDEQVNTLAEAALAAPSGMNAQPWQVVVLRNRETLARMDADTLEAMRTLGNAAAVERIASRGGKVLYNAPCLILLPVREGGLMDAGIAAENIALAAQSMGLGSCIIGLTGALFAGKKGEAWRKTLQFLEGYQFGISVAVGYKAAEGTPHARNQGKVTILD